MRALDLNLAALDIRRAGELLLHPCGCSTGTHRWRLSPCPERACTNGHVTVDGTTQPCLHCWSTCTNGQVLDEGGEHWRPCPLCKPHTLGEHLLRAKRDQRPGIRAASTDPRGTGTPTEDEDEDEEDSGGGPYDLGIVHDDQALTEYLDAVRACRRAARQLLDLGEKGRPDRTPKADSTTSDDQWCRNHLALGICEPRHRGDQCRWCRQFEKATGAAPPEVLLRARHDGQRITQPMVDAALRAANPKTKGKKRRK